MEDEKTKVDKFNPARYIVATSLSLNLAERTKIKAVLEPHIKDTNDIFDEIDLNKYLDRNQDIVEKYFKLWLTSTAVLRIILNNSVEAGSKFVAEKIRKNITLYVKNRNYYNAVKKLEEHKFILITGLPGVGKTILSYVLIYELLSKDFKLVYVDQDIKAAEKSFNEDENIKQVFLLDDFLGANYNEIVNPKSSHSSIVSFVERIQATPNKYCILTTRTNILKKANLSSEKLRRSTIEVSNMEIEVRDYDIFDKGRILYYHLFYNQLPIEYINQIFQDQNYWKIIKHKNYNPRIIEFITSKNILKQVIDGNSYLDRVLFNLENPEEIWKHAFENQIDKDDQLLVYTLFTFTYSVNKNALEVAFNDRVNYEITKNGYQKSNNSYENSISRLLESFIASSRDDEKITFQFVNPSINDFLLGYLMNSKEERLKLIDSCLHFSQFKKIVTTYDHFRKDKSMYLKEEWHYLVERIIELNTKLNFSDLNFAYIDDSGKKLFIAKLLSRMAYWIIDPSYLWDRIDQVVLSYLKEMNLSELIDWDFEEVINILNDIDCLQESQEFIKPQFISLMDKIIDVAWTLDHFKDIKNAFDAYDFKWGDYIENHSEKYNIKNRISDIVCEHVKDFVTDEKHSIYREGELDNLKDRASDEWNAYLKDLDLDLDFDEDGLFGDIHEQSLIEHNAERSYGDDFDDSDRETVYVMTPEAQVDNLFSKGIS